MGRSLGFAAVLAGLLGCGVGEIATSDSSAADDTPADGSDGNNDTPSDDTSSDDSDDTPSDDSDDTPSDDTPSDDTPSDDNPSDDSPSTPDAGTPDASGPDDPPDAGGPTNGLDCRNAASWPAEWVALEDAVLVRVNAERAAGATCGSQSYPPVGPVKMDSALREAARCHGLDMGVQNYFSHDSKDGRSPWDRIDEAGYTASATGENIAAGQNGSQSVMDGWMDSEGHCKNIMNGNSNEIGVGYALTEGSDYGRYWVQTFGHR